ncbi:MAG: HD domain-containing phosphohydrolase [Dehalococcoidia bacterium]
MLLRRSLPTVVPLLTLLACSSLAFALLRSMPDIDAGIVWASPTGHFWVVSLAAITCVALAFAAGVAAARTRNARVLMLALAFMSMAGIFTVHGLATPGVLVEGSYTGTYQGGAAYGTAVPGSETPAAWLFNLTGLSARLAVAVSACFLAASTIPFAPRIERAIIRWRTAILVAGGLAIVGYGVVGLTVPTAIPGWVVGSTWLAWMTLSGVVLLGGIAATRYAIGYVRTGQALFGAVALGSALLVQAQLSLHFGTIWQGTFWLYHLQLAAGFFAILWGVLIEYSRGRAVQSFANLAVSDVVEELRGSYAEPVLALSGALEARDGYTLGHGERVAAMSVLIAQEMRLSPARIRGLAAGALLHDVGKIGIPDAILHKGGRLEDHEFAVIQEHPDRGWNILRYILSEPGQAAAIRHHHEKWDGTGYPDHLAGEAIPLEARIVAVADVYDALRSQRAYREPMTPEAATDVIRGDAGRHFDPACVEAFLAVAGAWETKYAAAHVPYAERRALA